MAGMLVTVLAAVVLLARRVYQVFMVLAVVLTVGILAMVFLLEMTPERPELLACCALWFLTWGSERFVDAC